MKITNTTTHAHAPASAPARATLNVLIACEESQVECTAFRALGHNAFSCDIQLCRPKGHPEWHIQGDVTPYLHGTHKFVTMDGQHHHVEHWHLIIAHPPCTYLCRVSAVQLMANPDYLVNFDGIHKRVNRERWRHLKDARAFFFTCLKAKADYLAVENPIPMAIANLPRPSFYASPHWYGVKYSKKTLYWVRDLPPLLPTIEYPNPKSFVRCSRGKYRSRTFPAMAEAIARQWSQHILDDMANRH